MWKIKQFKTAKKSQDIKVSILVKEMAKNTYATNQEEFVNHFNQRLTEIPRSNNFSASLMWKMTPRNPLSVEVWKLTADGEYKEKFFMLEYEKN